MLRGLPGSGKTTFAEFLCDFLLPDLPVYCFAADDYFTDEEGNYNFKVDKLGAAHALCLNNTLNVMHNWKSGDEAVILVHNTFTTEKELEPYITAANGFKFEIISIVFENRHGHKSVHKVPDEVMGKMKNRFKVSL